VYRRFYKLFFKQTYAIEYYLNGIYSSVTSKLSKIISRHEAESPAREIGLLPHGRVGFVFLGSVPNRRDVLKNPPGISTPPLVPNPKSSTSALTADNYT
jgi:hypothetical protein